MLAGNNLVLFDGYRSLTVATINGGVQANTNAPADKFPEP